MGREGRGGKDEGEGGEGWKSWKYRRKKKILIEVIAAFCFSCLHNKDV